MNARRQFMTAGVVLALACAQGSPLARPATGASSRATLLGWIDGFHAWNDRAMALGNADPSLAMVRRIELEFAELVAAWTVPGSRWRALPSVSTTATFHRDYSHFDEVTERGDEATVLLFRRVPGLTGADAFEFKLNRIEGRWLIATIYYLDGARRWRW